MSEERERGSWESEAEELRRLGPRNLLFLCVANSARSQMAEAIARSLAPASVQVSSAGSRPSGVNPLAIRALAEIGIDIRSHRSRSVDSVAPDGVDAVITLCAEEVCPVFLGKARRIHWALPDPAGVQGSDAERLEAFRKVRDELLRRLRAVFDPALVFRLATPQDEPALRAFLTAAALPADDVSAERHEYVLAAVGGELVGTVGLEPCGDAALLRSLAVAPARRRLGLGTSLLERAVARAIERGMTTAYALTTTAERFCLTHGFERVPRAEVPPAIAATAQFRSLCPKSAACFRLRLAQPRAYLPGTR